MDDFFNRKNDTASVKNNTSELAEYCINQEKYLEALIILKNITQEDRPDIFFNTALCYINAENYEMALTYLLKALPAVKKYTPALPDVFKKNLPEYVKMRIAQIDNKMYTKPMSLDYIKKFTEITKENITLNLIDIYLKLGLADKAEGLLNALTGEEFTEYKRERS